MIFLGCDPGKNGAITVFNNKQIVKIVQFPIMPKPNKKGTQIDCQRLLLEAQKIRKLKPKMAFIENVGSRPNQNSKSTFSFGRELGVLEMAISYIGVNNENIKRIHPQTWKSYFGLINKTKDDSRFLAIEIFDDMKKEFYFESDDGKAESALIGLYSYMMEIE